MTYTVAEVMTTKLLSVPSSASVAEAATLMGQHRSGSTLVMEGDDLLGIFTERDILRALGQHFDAGEHPVSSWMTSDPVTVPRETAVRDALKIMLHGEFRHLPVVDGARVVGIVSMRDLSAILGGNEQREVVR